MNCPKCGKPGYTKPPLGQPRKLDDAKVRRLRERGWEVARIAEKYAVHIDAVYKSLKRSKVVTCEAGQP